MAQAGHLEHDIGRRLCNLRKERALSQEELADRLSVSYQQIQKYEKGRTRISVSRLCELSHALEVPLTELLPLEWCESAIPEPLTEPEPEPEEQEQLSSRFVLTRDEMRLLKLYRKIQSEKLRKIVLDYLRTVNES